MICANWTTYSQSNETRALNASGRWYEAPCAASDSVVMTYGEYVALVPANTVITASEILYVVSWGFGVVLLGWAIGYILGLVIGIIKKI